MRVAPDAASGTSLRTRHADQARAILQDRLGRHSLRVLNPEGTVDFTLRQAQLDCITFFEISYGSDVEVFTSGLIDCYLLQLTLAGTCDVTTTEGRAEIGPGGFYVVNPSTAYRERWSSDATQLIVKLPRRPVDRLARADSEDRPVIFEQSSDPLPGPLDDLVKFLWRDLTTQGRARSSVIDRSAGNHLTKALLHLLPNSAVAVSAPDDLPACLFRADRYIRENLAGEIGLVDIAAAAGVSTRALENAFRRHWRTTPVAHVRNLRLEAAHSLLTDPVDGMSVTDAALACGFTHLGRFSQGYSRRFGELPSQSRRRALAATN
ncbi:AraC family transcriptional regulator [Mycobacterium heidelbergense]|uniref:Uncharacterized protein n=2 Tax=Mycobacterium heidelbergense TaxID=53376 RepID=A0A1X0DLQ7_MYCHE|nr:AraC family transcriptional regulator [Mycobacterium heidelbergense]ORA73257.1 hypothetical protein BST25_13080 [Mycobacterium heidelbergense]BBZ52003.1 AraC family transcriptional regulator [Mycobacterium heidelbergense]